jgi:hypothetical protein
MRSCRFAESQLTQPDGIPFGIDVNAFGTWARRQAWHGAHVTG